MKLPPQYADPPELLPGLHFYYTAYERLRSCATFNGDIPWTAVMEYADRLELDQEMRHDTWILVRSMNLAEMDYQSKKAEKKGTDKGQTGSAANSGQTGEGGAPKTMGTN